MADQPVLLVLDRHFDVLLLAGCQTLEGLGVHQAGDRLSAKGLGAHEEFLESGVHVQDSQVLVEDHDAVGAGLNDPIDALLGEPLHVGNAHFRLGHAADDRHGLVAAGSVAAGAAVELVFLPALPVIDSTLRICSSEIGGTLSPVSIVKRAANWLCAARARVAANGIALRGVPCSQRFPKAMDVLGAAMR